MVRVRDVARTLEIFAPLRFALPGDNCGLQVGDPSRLVKAILVALDPSPEAVRRAVSRRADLLVTHHPLFHEPVRRIDTRSPSGAAAAMALAADMAVYSAHTNLDASPGGLACELARRAGLQEVRPLEPCTSEHWFKLVVFVPRSSLDMVHRSMADAGAGMIGNYDRCAFVSEGKGMFRPLEGARPAVGGGSGKTEKVEEYRLEMLVEDRLCGPVIGAMKTSHPYEEVAYDLYPLERPEAGGCAVIGMIGKVRFRRFARQLAEKFRTGARVSGKKPFYIEKVAVVPGSGGGYLQEAARQGAQAMVTGEIRYHQMLEAEHLGIGVIELGHDRSEMPAVDLLSGALRRDLAGKKVGIFTFRRSPTAGDA